MCLREKGHVPRPPGGDCNKVTSTDDTFNTVLHVEELCEGRHVHAKDRICLWQKSLYRFALWRSILVRVFFEIYSIGFQDLSLSSFIFFLILLLSGFGAGLTMLIMVDVGLAVLISISCWYNDVRVGLIMFVWIWWWSCRFGDVPVSLTMFL